MLATMLGLALLYAGLFVALFLIGAHALVIAAVCIVIVGFQVAFADKVALKGVGAQTVSREQAPALHAAVERLCIQADIPKPRLAIAAIDMPNAFAIGRSRKSATVCVTNGLLHHLNAQELEGVIAHELAHVKNRDVLVMTIASFVASVALMMMQLYQFSIRLFFAFIAVGIATYFLGRLMLLALSRHREFAADRTAALMTGRPSALASALVKVSSQMALIPTTDLRATRKLSAFFVVSPDRDSFLGRVLATHPPLKDRITALNEIEGQMHGGSFDSDLMLAAENEDLAPVQIIGQSAAAAGFAPIQQQAIAPQQAQPQPQPAATAGGWYPDPWRAARLRWFDGRTWTGHTSN